MKNPIPVRLFAISGGRNDGTYSIARYGNKLVITALNGNSVRTVELPTHAAARKAMGQPGSLF